MTSRINVLKYPCKVLFLSDFNENQNVSANFREEFSARNFIKILPVTVALFYANRLAIRKASSRFWFWEGVRSVFKVGKYSNTVRTWLRKCALRILCKARYYILFKKYPF
jgi:hypothetical protein